MDPKRYLTVAGRYLAWIIVPVALVMLAIGLMSGPIANAILANAVDPSDRELPVTAFALPFSAEDVQPIGGQGQGLDCSLPLGAETIAFPRWSNEAPISLQMRQACAFHDYCYRHGEATYGYSQADCDFLLQEHAFRICPHVFKESSVESCKTLARKVTLGVRLGGAGSYKRLDGDGLAGSTYFEFDPYPVRSSHYTAVRLADAPAGWRSSGALQKALYIFDVRPSGLRLSIVGWTSDGGTVCAGILIAGQFGFLSTPPVVVRDGPDGEEWFVWWQRRNLSQTGGRFAIVSPSRARLDDWKVIGATGEFSTPDCRRNLGISTSATSLELPAARVIELRPISDLSFSEVHAAPDTRTDNILLMQALTTHGCAGDGDNSSCLARFRIAPSRRTLEVSDIAFRAHDPSCVGSSPGAARSVTCDRYRSFVTAPYGMSSDGLTLLAWLRRGASDGTGFSDEAILRRFTAGSTAADWGQNLGSVRLLDFPESAEPVALVGRTTSTPFFLSLSTRRQFVLSRWVLPPLSPLRSTQTEPAIQVSERDAIAGDCQAAIGADWLARPPLVVTSQADTKIVLTRIVTQHSAGAGSTASLETLTATVSGQACSTHSSRDLTPELDAAPLQCANPSKQKALTPQGLRSMPTLVGDMDGDGRNDLIVANPILPCASSLIRGDSEALFGSR